MTETAVAARRQDRPPPVRTVVRSTRYLSPELVRVVLHADDWSGFRAPQHTDSYVKLVFASPGDERPRMRTYTVRRFDADAGTLGLDVVVHGTEGLAGPWAAHARPGDPMPILGAGGGYSPDPAAGWHLLAGDASALPAIANALEALPEDAQGAAFVEVADARHEVPLDAPAGVEVRWLHVGSAVPGSVLVPTVRAWAAPAGTGHAFVHGEAGFVRELRRHLRHDRGLEPERLSASGYWRLGADDERWRAMKADWNRAVEQDDAAPA